MALADEEYRYPRDIKKDEIRLLTLQPSEDFEDEIVIGLETMPRESVKSYTALSYCWGSPTNPKFIRATCKDATGKLPITQDLDSALRYLRDKKDPRILWIDQCCINQGSHDDRSEQVYRMDEIYSNASEVIGYLGPPHSNSDLAMRLINELASQFDEIVIAEVPDQDLTLPALLAGHPPEIYVEAMFNLMLRPWFQRLWIVQEICLAPRNAYIVCGRKRVAFHRLTNLQVYVMGKQILQQFSALPAVQRYQFLISEPPVGLTRHYFRAAMELGHREERESKSTLLSHVWNFRNKDCTEPKDRIYALLSLATQSERKDLPPSYKDNASKTFIRATKLMLVSGVVHGPEGVARPKKSLSVLSMCQGPGEESLRHRIQSDPTPEKIEVPSWVPNFDLYPTQRPLDSLTRYVTLNSSRDIKPYFWATGDSAADPRFSENGLELVLDGYEVGVIDNLGLDPEKDNLVDWAGALQRSHSFAHDEAFQALKKYEDVTNAFWRTLITNRTKFRSVASDQEEGEEFKLWWENIFTNPLTRSKETEESYLNYQSAFLQHYLNRNFFTTFEGFMGLCNGATRVRDEVWLLAGSQVPFVLRATGEKYLLIGECYMHGAMYGDFWDSSKKGKLTLV